MADKLEFIVDVSGALKGVEELANKGQAALNELSQSAAKGIRVPEVKLDSAKWKAEGEKAGSAMESGVMSKLKELKEKTSESLGDVGKIAGGLLLGGGALAGVQGLEQGLERVWDIGSETVEVEEKLKSALAGNAQMADIVAESAEKVAAKYKLDADSVKELSTSYLNMGGHITSAANAEQVQIATLEIAKAGHMDAANAAMLLAKSIDSPTNALARYGVRFAKGATEAEKFAAIQKTFGANAKAMEAEAKDPELFLQHFQVTIKNLAESIGSKLVHGVNAVGSALATAWSAIQPTMEEIWNIISGVFVDIWQNDILPMWDSIKSSFSDLFSTIGDLFGSVGGQGMSFGDIIKVITTYIKDYIAAALIPLQVTFKVVSFAISNIISVTTEMYKIFITIASDAISPLVTWLEHLFSSTDKGSDSVSIFTKIWNGLVFGFTHFQSIVQGVMSALDALIAQVKSAGAGIGEFLEGVVSFNPAKIKEGFGKVSDAMSGIGQAMKDGFTKGFEGNEIKEAAEKSADAVEDVKTKVAMHGGKTGKKPKAEKEFHDDTLKNIDEFLEKREEKEKTGREKELADTQDAYKAQQAKLDRAMAERKISIFDYTKEVDKLTESEREAIVNINKKWDEIDLKNQQKAEQEKLDAKRKADDEFKKLGEEARKRKEEEAKKEEEDFKKNNAAYKAGMTGMESVVNQGLSKIEDNFARSFHTQNTVVGQAMQSMVGSLAKSLAQTITSQDGFIAKNLVVAASAITSAAASVFSFFASIPFVGIPLGVAAVAGVIAEFGNIKKALGFATGGIGMVGEKGAEIIAPVKDFTKGWDDLTRQMTQALVSNMRAGLLNGGTQANSKQLSDIHDAIKSLTAQQEKSMLNVHITGTEKSEEKISGEDIAIAKQRSFHHIAQVTA